MVVPSTKRHKRTAVTPVGSVNHIVLDAMMNEVEEDGEKTEVRVTSECFYG